MRRWLMVVLVVGACEGQVEETTKSLYHLQCFKSSNGFRVVNMYLDQKPYISYGVTKAKCDERYIECEIVTSLECIIEAQR